MARRNAFLASRSAAAASGDGSPELLNRCPPLIPSTGLNLCSTRLGLQSKSVASVAVRVAPSCTLRILPAMKRSIMLFA